MNPSKRKGTAFETAVVRYLQANGHPNAERRALTGNQDRGDIANIPDFALECKAVQSIALAQFIDEATREAINAGARYGAAIIKRRQKPVDQAYVVMTLEQFTDLINNRRNH